MLSFPFNKKIKAAQLPVVMVPGRALTVLSPNADAPWSLGKRWLTPNSAHQVLKVQPRLISQIKKGLRRLAV